MLKRTLSTLVAAAFACAALAPGLAAADDDYYGRGGYGGYYGHGHGRFEHGGYGGRGYYDGGRGHRGHGDGDAVAAGVIGLALGAIIGAAVNENNQAQRYAAPPPAYYPPPPPRYYDGYGGGYAPPRVCVERERVWDPYAGQYVRVERRVPC